MSDLRRRILMGEENALKLYSYGAYNPNLTSFDSITYDFYFASDYMQSDFVVFEIWTDGIYTTNPIDLTGYKFTTIEWSLVGDQQYQAAMGFGIFDSDPKVPSQTISIGNYYPPVNRQRTTIDISNINVIKKIEFTCLFEHSFTSDYKLKIHYWDLHN